MFLKRRTRLTREGWYYLLVLGFVVTGAMLREINLLMIMAGLLIGPLLLNWRMAVSSLRSLRVSRRLPETIGAGEVLAVDVTADSRPGWLPRLTAGGWAVTVEDIIRRIAGGVTVGELRTSVFFWRVPRGTAARVAYRGRLLRRGRYAFGPLTVSTRFPLGLVRRQVVVNAAQELIVLPKLGRLTSAWRTFCRRVLHAERGGRSQQVALEGDFHSLRDWRPGDARRQIHWRTTARRRMPVVRRLERPQQADVAVLLDLASFHAGGDDEAVERAVSFVATIVSDLCRQGSGWLMLATAGDGHHVLRGAPSAAMLRACLLHLATLEPGRGDAWEPMLSEVLSTLRRDMQVVVITTRGDFRGISTPTQSMDGDGQQLGWVGAGGRPIEPTLLIDAASPQLDDYFVSSDSELSEKQEAFA